MILLEDMIARNMSQLFLSYDVLCVHPYRIMRNADLTIDEMRRRTFSRRSRSS